MKKKRNFGTGGGIPLRTGVLMVALVAMAVFLFILLLSPREEENALSQLSSPTAQTENMEPVPGTEAQAPTALAGEPTLENTAITAHLVGAVAKPGIVMLQEGARVFEAIAQAGGFTKQAAPEALNLAEPVVDGAQIRVPTKAEAKNMTAEEPPGQKAPNVDDQKASTGQADPAPGSTTTTVNVNTADSTTLQLLPGVGPATAAKIIEHREQFGKFSNADELTAVRGIGPATVEKLRDRLSF